MLNILSHLALNKKIISHFIERWIPFPSWKEEEREFSSQVHLIKQIHLFGVCFAVWTIEGA